MQIKKYKVIGMMSGTSLDGVDLSLANYYKKDNKWNFDMLNCKTFAYQNKHVKLIRKMEQLNCPYLEFRKIQIQYSQVLVNFIKQFIEQNIQHSADIDFICLHGHTIFHQPNQGITVQVANLQYIAAKLKADVIGNFRELDVHRGGQGAPLAPFGEQLFEKGIYLNLGGIANVGYKAKGHDIVFCNMILNKFSQKIDNKLFDFQGQLGRKGNIDQQYFAELKNNFQNTDKHSLARQQAQKLLHHIQVSTQTDQVLINKMRTFYQFISFKIVQSILQLQKQQYNKQSQNCSVICTGGGAYNSFLIQLLNDNKYNIKFVVPDSHLIQFKQALIFGLLGVKFMENEWNCQSGIGGQLIKGKLTVKE